MTGQALTHAGAVVVRELGGVPEFLVIDALNKPQEKVLPKGHIRAGEAPEATALRELREEAGIEGEILAPLGIHEFDAPNEHVRAIFYLVDFLRQVPAEEARQQDWCHYEEALQRLAYADARHLIEQARTEWQQRRLGSKGRAND